MNIFKRILKISALVIGIILIIGIVSITLILEPNFKIAGWQNLDVSKLSSASRTLTILDANNNVIENIYDNNKMFTPIDKIPTKTIDAFISIEDKRFFNHSGIDYLRIGGAIKANLFSKEFKEGASTISQQLIKNTHLSNKKTIKRKLQELRISRALERKYSKSQILEMYLNILYYGNNIYGIGTATKILFNKNVENLDIGESATLAGIINNPSKYNPYLNINNTISRRNLVLKQMFNLNKISQAEYNSAINSKLIIAEKGSNNAQYVNSVLKEASTILNIPEKDLFKHNYTIQTNFKNAFQEAVFHSMRGIGSNIDALNRIILMKNNTGEVLCDYSNSNLNLSYTARQPGSTIKPLLCYAPAFEKKLIYPCSHILDKQVSFGKYSPSNYKNKYYGYTTIKESLIHSMNIPAIKLLEMNGIEYSKSYLKRCGINFTNEDNSLALALGGMNKGLNLNEIANLYQILGNNGKYIPASYIKNILNSSGKIIYSNNSLTKQILQEDTAYLITDILEECAKTGTAKRLSSLKNVAAKTGTVGVDDFNTDAYCIAYTQDYTIAVWFGSKNNNTFNTISGGGLPTITAEKIINKLNLNYNQFNVPKGIVNLKIDAIEQAKNHRIILATTNSPLKNCKTEIFSIKNLPKQYSYEILPDIFKKDFIDIEFNDKNYKIIDNFQLDFTESA